MTKKLLLVVFAFALVVAACSDDDGSTFTTRSTYGEPGTKLTLEIETDGYVLFDTIFGYELSRGLTFLAILQNIMDETYRASADEAGVDAPGRGLDIPETV